MVKETARLAVKNHHLVFLPYLVFVGIEGVHHFLENASHRVCICLNGNCCAKKLVAKMGDGAKETEQTLVRNLGRKAPSVSFKQAGPVEQMV